jgi:hypothetical protein
LVCESPMQNMSAQVVPYRIVEHYTQLSTVNLS